MRYFILIFTLVCSFVAAQPTIVPQLQQQVTDLTSSLNSQEKKELTRKLESIFNISPILEFRKCYFTILFHQCSKMNNIN